MTITQFPTPPSRSDAPDLFVTRADAFVAAFPNFVDEVNPEIININERSDQVAADTLTVVAAKDAALSAANFKGAWSDLTGALNVPAAVSHSGAIWLLLENLADVTLSEPSGVNADWFLYDFVSEARTLTAGTGLLGGGNLTEDRTFNIDESATGDVQGFVNDDKVVTTRRLRTAAAFAAPSGASNWTPNWGTFVSAEWVVSANRTMNNPTATIPGTVRTVWIKGNDAASRTISFGSAYTGAESGLPPEILVTSTVGFRIVMETTPNGEVYVTGGEWTL